MTDRSSQPPRDHGGNLDAAIHRYGGARADWLDLSTGINPVAYPVGQVSADAWQALPRASDMQTLCAAAARAYRTSAPIAAFAGAQGAIQAIPHLAAPGAAHILTPTYNEHAGALRDAGWDVREHGDLQGLAGADLAVVVNPNNPDGRAHDPAFLMELSSEVGLLVVDESFADPEPDLSLAPSLRASDNVVILRSFGKFYGLAGMRLGFAIGSASRIARLRALAGPWPVSGPAMEIARAAFADSHWQMQTVARLGRDAVRLDALAAVAGWRLVGGTPLFRTYATPDARAAQERLAEARIWTRIFPYDATWMRLGLPGDATGWQRLEAALRGING